ncbi:MAG: Mur ligase family protein, partial [Pseudomonadota bacterium]
LHDNPRAAYAQLAARIYGPQPPKICAVTGTNGKSSIVEFCRQIAQGLGVRSASMGTLGIRSDTRDEYGNLTTPDAACIHQNLQELAKDGVEFVALEASSHGLSMHRLDGVAICAGAFSNLTQDHLDYHQDMREYFAAKSRLFHELLPKGAHAVLNSDDENFTTLRQICQARAITIWAFGQNTQIPHVCVQKWQATPDGADVIFLIHMIIKGKTIRQEIKSSIALMGEFQAHNIACALALCAACLPEQFLARYEDLPAIIASLQAPKGRVEIVARHPENNAQVIVDFAHTPDAIQSVFVAIRKHTGNGRMLCVLGAGGDRPHARSAARRPPSGTNPVLAGCKRVWHEFQGGTCARAQA